MARSTPVEAAADERDLFEATSKADFASKFPADSLIASASGAKKPAPSGSMVGRVAKGGEEEESPSAFSKWWSQDSTQEKFQVVMGSLGNVFAGMAGIPLGGGDMSSMERAAVRNQQLPEQVRTRMQKRRFERYVKDRMDSETDPAKKDRWMALLHYPEQTAQYLAMETPESKEGRAERGIQLQHKLGLEKLDVEIEGRKAVARISKTDMTPTMKQNLVAAKSWFYAQSPETQAEWKAGKYQWNWRDVDPARDKYFPLQFAEDMPLHNNGMPTPVQFGDENSPGAGAERAVDNLEEESGGILTWASAFWEWVSRSKVEKPDPGELSEAAAAAAKRAGLR